ncbi:kinesin-like protein Klp8 [Tulasnella sp. JGI-2019a]|nr:kinesin-like protein Klp8 [Tulasnella sp. JGI-2019a]
MEAGDGNIKVVVRCRPLNSREIARGAKELIRMQGNQTFLDPPDLTTDKGGQASRAVERKTMAFSFDKSYWSAGPRTDPDYCSQQTLYDDLGKELLDHGFAGFNACILAYGQTGSGKSYSMMGYGADKGIIPQTCSELFDRAEAKMATDPNTKYTVEVSYIEIYNEKVRDLLNPRNKGNLKVREHPSLGPYVEDLSKLVVAGYDEMMNLMDEGNKARTVAATNMNETSSRSHAVFTLLLTQKRHDNDTNLDTEKVSRISLVDLAGSERAKSTGASGAQLKEGANINKSLTTLGKVISALALASQSEGKPKGKKAAAAEHIPYRDSVLTWLLKDSIGGNSKTAMIAAISPADYDETLSTLRYADQAKKIKNKAVVNEDPNAKLVRELKEELEMLRARVSGSSGEDVFDPKVPAAMQKVTYQAKDGTVKTVTKAELQEQLQSSEKLMQSLNETWEEKLTRTQEVHKEREKALEELGITVEKSGIGVHTPKKMPHLVNLAGVVFLILALLFLTLSLLTE